MANRVAIKVVLTEEQDWRLRMHALVERKAPGEILGELIAAHLPDYKVTIRPAVEAPAQRP